MNDAKRISRLLDLNRRGLQSSDPNSNLTVSGEWKNAGGICLLRGRRSGEPRSPSSKKPWKRTYTKKSPPSSDAENLEKVVTIPDAAIDLPDTKTAVISKTGTGDIKTADSSTPRGIRALMHRIVSFLVGLIKRRGKPPTVELNINDLVRRYRMIIDD